MSRQCEARRGVIVFRQQLFKRSEPFIYDQAAALTRYHAICCGRIRVGPTVNELASVALGDAGGIIGAVRAAFQPILRVPGRYQRLLERLEWGGVRLIHAHFGMDAVQALPLARALGIPLVTTFHGFDATSRIRRFLFSKSPSLINYALYRRSLFRSGQLFLCVSRFIQQHVVRMGVPEECTRVHHIGVDLDRIRPRALDEEQPLVIHVARLVEKKGTAYLIRAFARIASDHPGIRLEIIGDGPLRAKLERLAAACGVAQRVKFLGAQPHPSVLAAMRVAQALVLPSVTARSGDAEGLGMVLLEAAATGVAQIGTAHGGIPEAVDDGETGYLVPEHDVDALADRLGRLLDDVELRRSMGAAGRRMVETRFSLKRQCSALEDIYDEVIACRKKR